MQNRTETLGIGSRAPDFSLTAANREGIFSLSRLRADGPAVLGFLRGTWGPNCVKRMAQFEPLQSELERAGAKVVFIAAEKRDGMFKPVKFLEKHTVGFP